jgi:hypothetical protein
VIVLEVDVDYVLAIKGESEPKVTGHGNGPTSFPIAPEGMQSPAGNVHVLRAYGDVQSVQHSIDPRTMLVWNSACSAIGEEPGEAFVAKGADHVIAN